MVVDLRENTFADGFNDVVLHLVHFITYFSHLSHHPSFGASNTGTYFITCLFLLICKHLLEYLNIVCIEHKNMLYAVYLGDPSLASRPRE